MTGFPTISFPKIKHEAVYPVDAIEQAIAKTSSKERLKKFLNVLQKLQAQLQPAPKASLAQTKDILAIDIHELEKKPLDKDQQAALGKINRLIQLIEGRLNVVPQTAAAPAAPPKGQGAGPAARDVSNVKEAAAKATAHTATATATSAGTASDILEVVSDLQLNPENDNTKIWNAKNEAIGLLLKNDLAGAVKAFYAVIHLKPQLEVKHTDNLDMNQLFLLIDQFMEAAKLQMETSDRQKDDPFLKDIASVAVEYYNEIFQALDTAEQMFLMDNGTKLNLDYDKNALEGVLKPIGRVLLDKIAGMKDKMEAAQKGSIIPAKSQLILIRLLKVAFVKEEGAFLRAKFGKV
jgi:hypothetical protein